MEGTPAGRFLLNKAAGEISSEMSPAELLGALASLQLSGYDQVLGIVYTTDLLCSCLSHASPLTLPNLEPLISLAEDLHAQGHNRTIQSFCTVLARTLRSQHINSLTSETILKIADLTSSFAGQLDASEYLDLLSLYLSSPDKAVFSIGIKIVDSTRGIESLMLSPASAADNELAAMVTAGSFVHQVTLAPHFANLSRINTIFQHMDRFAQCYGLYNSLLTRAYTFILSKVDPTGRESTRTNTITPEAHARAVLSVVFPYLFQPSISVPQLDFLADLLALATQHAQSDALHNALVDIVGELRDIADLYDDSAFLSRVSVLQKTNYVASFLPEEPLLFAEYIRKACNQKGGMFQIILIRLAVCIYRLETLLCKRNTSVKYGAIIRTDQMSNIDGKPMSECEDLAKEAQRTDAPQELKLYVNMRHLSKGPLRKS